MQSRNRRTVHRALCLCAWLLAAACAATISAAPAAKAAVPSKKAATKTAKTPATRPAADTAAPTTGLAGNLPGVVFARSQPYHVVADIYVPAGKRVNIEAGTVFLFKNFTGLQVEGVLAVNGTKEHPVVFTSENDTDYNPAAAGAAAYDWNGITILESGIGAVINFSAVIYSVFGVNAMTKYVKLNDCLFLHNGRGNLAVEGQEQKVTDQPFSYAYVVNDSTRASVPAELLRDPKAPLRNLARYSGLSVFAGGAVLGVWYSTRLSQSAATFRALRGADPYMLAGHTSADWQAARKQRNSDAIVMTVGYLLSALGATGFGIAFTF
jgi:hypothetical protein